MEDYHILCLKCDVLFLVHMSEENRNNCLRNYTLCSCDYLSAPALSWDVILDITKIEVDLFSHVEMHLFFEEGMRGDIFYISKR